MAVVSVFLTGIETLKRPLLHKRTLLADKLFTCILVGISVVVLIIIGLLLGVFIYGGWESIKTFGIGFISSKEWDPVNEVYGALPFIVGTLVSSILALLLAVPIGLSIAIFLSDICPKAIRRYLSFIIELLAAIPSVIYGFWGIFVLVPWIR